MSLVLAAVDPIGGWAVLATAFGSGGVALVMTNKLLVPVVRQALAERKERLASERLDKRTVVSILTERVAKLEALVEDLSERCDRAEAAERECRRKLAVLEGRFERRMLREDGPPKS